MRARHVIVLGLLALLGFAYTGAEDPVSAQGASAAAARFATTPNFTPPSSTYTAPKTQWGDPDLSGTYDFMTFIRMERPAEFADKKVLTEAELEAYRKRYELNQDACGVGTRKDEDCTAEEAGAVGAYNEFWDTRKWVKDLRTSLIVDPDNGRMPPMVPDAQQRQQVFRKARAGFPRVINSWHDFPTVSRCISEQTPNGPQMYNSGTMIVQSPGWVALIRERLDTRYISLTQKTHLDDKIRLWHGHSVGRWEGSTLVVDTTNFNDKQIMGGVGSTIPAGIPLNNMHLVERFVPIGPNTIHYYATIEDPTVWTRPWTFMLPWQKDPDYVIYEYACEEGNLSIENSLRGARLQEQREAALAKLPSRDHLTMSLIGRTEAQVRARLGEPSDASNMRWTYMTASGNPLYVFFEKAQVKLVQPNDLELAAVRRR